MPKLKIQKGDIFYFQVEEKYAVGVVLHYEKKQFTIGIINKLFSEQPNMNSYEDVKSVAKVIVIANTHNLFFELGRWLIFGNINIEFSTTQFFKIETNEGTFVCDSSLNLIRKATDSEAQTLTYVTSVSPAVIVTTTKMYFGIEPINESYRKYFVNS